MPQIFLDFNKLKTASKFLTYSLLVALPLTFSTNVLAEPTISPIPTGSQPANSSGDAIVKKLLGQWSKKDLQNVIMPP